MSRTVAVLGEWPESMLGTYLVSPAGVTVPATRIAPKTSPLVLQLGWEYRSQKVALLGVGDDGFQAVALASRAAVDAVSARSPSAADIFYFFFPCSRCHVGARN